MLSIRVKKEGLIKVTCTTTKETGLDHFTIYKEDTIREIGRTTE